MITVMIMTGNAGIAALELMKLTVLPFAHELPMNLTGIICIQLDSVVTCVLVPLTLILLNSMILCYTWLYIYYALFCSFCFV